MAQTVNRRAALRSIFAAGAAAAAVPAAALSGDPDAELFALQGAIDAADREFDVSIDNASAAQERFCAIRKRLPAVPAAPADPEWDRILADFAGRMAAYRKLGPRPEKAAYDEAVKSRELAEANARLECGLADLEEIEAEKLAVVTGLQQAVIAIEARTLSGLIFKAKYAATHYASEYDLDVMVSIVDDLLAMAGEA
jgi:hypothetical protein